MIALYGLGFAIGVMTRANIVIFSTEKEVLFRFALLFVNITFRPRRVVPRGSCFAQVDHFQRVGFLSTRRSLYTSRIHQDEPIL